jgi:hypothetical protein
VIYNQFYKKLKKKVIEDSIKFDYISKLACKVRMADAAATAAAATTAIFLIPTLATLAYRVFRTDANDRDAEKVISRNPLGFRVLESLDIVFWQMLARIEEIVCHDRIRGKIFGGYCRDKIALTVPKDIDVRFESSEDREAFIIQLLEEFDVIFMEKKNFCRYPELVRYQVTTILVVHREFRQIFIPMDLTVESDWINTRPDFDVNQLAITHMSGEVDFNMSYHNKCVLTKRILAGVLLVFDAKGVPNSDHDSDCSECIHRQTWDGGKLLERMAKMKSRGWIVDGEGSCSNPTCFLATEASWKAHCDKLEAERLALKMARAIERAKAKAIRYLQWRMAQVRICSYEPPNFKELHREKMATRHRARVRGNKYK